MGKAGIVLHTPNLFHNLFFSRYQKTCSKLIITILVHNIQHTPTQNSSKCTPQTSNHWVLRPTIMLFKLLIPFTLAAVFGVRATPVFHFPDVILRAEIPVGITVHEYNATAAALGASVAPKLKPRGLFEERSDCLGSRPSCKWYIATRDCIAAYMVRSGKQTQAQTYIPRGNLFSRLRGIFSGLTDSF